MFDGVDVNKAWIETKSGTRFHILEPQQEEIAIVDIAHALSMMCRFTGHVRKFYSVAEHSWHVSHLVPAKEALWGLLHDASEAYIADINRPLKHFTPVGESYMKVEKKIMDAICKRFGLPSEEPEAIRNADTAMLYAEKSFLMTPLSWDTKWGTGNPAASVDIRCWGPEIGEAEFLHRFYHLTNQL
jgi:uncharacterized protein